jgi:hypothetical protein
MAQNQARTQPAHAAILRQVMLLGSAGLTRGAGRGIVTNEGNILSDHFKRPIFTEVRQPIHWLMYRKQRLLLA